MYRRKEIDVEVEEEDQRLLAESADMYYIRRSGYTSRSEKESPGRRQSAYVNSFILLFLR